MPNAAASPSDAPGWIGPAALIVLAVTAFRVVLLAFNRTDLFVDEAQYWLWGQELELGYYSKPPLVGWVIRAATEAGGSDAAFWVRLPAPLLHAGTALALGALAAPRFGARAAIWVVATYITLPMVSLGSLLISTDTVMAPFLVLGLWAWLHGLDRGGVPGWAFLAGLAVGVAFLAKYAAIYYVLCAALAAAAGWRARPGWGPALLALAGFLIAISPNVVWNLQNGFSTLEHTLDNADWVRDPGTRAALNLPGLGEFFASQFAVFGPVLFATLLWMGVRYAGQTPLVQILLIFSLPIVAIVCVQALLSEAYANWAAAAYLAGSLAVVPWLHTHAPRWLAGSLALHLALAAALPVASIWGTGWRAGADGPLLLARYVGRTEMSQRILAEARTHGLDVIVADDRDVLADLFHQGRDSGLRLYARPEAGRPSNHYVLRHALPPEVTGPVLFVSKRDAPPDACPQERQALFAPESGAYAHRWQRLFIVPAECLAP